jgi:hypothetical protein
MATKVDKTPKTEAHEEHLHVTRFTASNFKRLVAVAVDADGAVIVGGDNEQGKSSLLDGIRALLQGEGAIPGVPVHKGADKAVLEGNIGPTPSARMAKPSSRSSERMAGSTVRPCFPAGLDRWHSTRWRSSGPSKRTKARCCKRRSVLI